MAENKLFIVSALLLLGLVAGASYLQTTYATAKPPRAADTARPAAADADTMWHISTGSSAAPSIGATPTAAASKPAPAVAPARAIHRVYNDDSDNDN